MLGDFFDPKAEFSIREHCRPHWCQAGAVVFITFRTRDSVPAEVVARWEREKKEWLAKRGLGQGRHWSAVLPGLSEADKFAFNKYFNRCREVFLDRCEGKCLLSRPDLAKIVADSLLHFDGVRYRMGDFVIMPNHVHLLAAFTSEEAMNQTCDSWLHFTAFQINRLIGAKGSFWQEEPFDHIVRSPEQFDHLREYIRENPMKAGLKAGSYFYRRHQGI